MGSRISTAHAHAHLYFHRSQTVEQLARHQREREEDWKEHREHLHRRLSSLILGCGYGFISVALQIGISSKIVKQQTPDPFAFS
jgi:hypothetical protein